MEAVTDGLTPQPDPPAIQKQRVEAAFDFLSICDRLSTATADRWLRQWVLLGRCPTCFADCCWFRKVAATADRPTNEAEIVFINKYPIVSH